jgi:hypothetical protein
MVESLSITDNLGLLASKAVGPTAARGQIYGIAAAVGKGQWRRSPQYVAL